MAVGTSQTGARILRVFEAIAFHQPIGVRALARLVEEDKSAIHRAIATLAAEGWIQPTGESQPQWEISPRIVSIADKAFTGYDLKRRAKPVLQRLRDECSETVVLIVLEGNFLVVADVIESRRMLRWVPPVGSLAPAELTAAGRAIIPYLDPQRQAEVLGHEVDEDIAAIYALTRSRGYSISDRETSPVSASVGAPIFDGNRVPTAVITIVGPSERIAEVGHEHLGRMAIEAAEMLSK